MFESVDEGFPPVVVFRKDYEGCQESVTGCYMKWGLLEVDESLGDILAVGVIDGREAIICPASVDGRKGKRKRCEGGRPNDQGDLCMTVRKVVDVDRCALEETYQR